MLSTVTRILEGRAKRLKWHSAAAAATCALKRIRPGEEISRVLEVHTASVRWVFFGLTMKRWLWLSSYHIRLMYGFVDYSEIVNDNDDAGFVCIFFKLKCVRWVMKKIAWSKDIYNGELHLIAITIIVGWWARDEYVCWAKVEIPKWSQRWIFSQSKFALQINFVSSELWCSRFTIRRTRCALVEIKVLYK